MSSPVCQHFQAPIESRAALTLWESLVGSNDQGEEDAAEEPVNDAMAAEESIKEVTAVSPKARQQLVDFLHEARIRERVDNDRTSVTNARSVYSPFSFQRNNVAQPSSPVQQPAEDLRVPNGSNMVHLAQ